MTVQLYWLLFLIVHPLSNNYHVTCIPFYTFWYLLHYMRWHTILVHVYSTFHVPVLSLHEHSSTLDIVFYVNTHYIRYCYFIYKYHCYTDTDTHDTIIACSWTTGTRIRYYTGYRYTDTLYAIIHVYIDVTQIHWYACIDCLCISYCVDHYLFYMNYCYMDILVFSLHDYFSLLILIFPLLDMWNIDMRYVKLSATWI